MFCKFKVIKYASDLQKNILSFNCQQFISQIFSDNSFFAKALDHLILARLVSNQIQKYLNTFRYLYGQYILIKSKKEKSASMFLKLLANLWKINQKLVCYRISSPHTVIKSDASYQCPISTWLIRVQHFSDFIVDVFAFFLLI